MQARKKNMERMAEVVPGSDEQVLQHFLSNSSWDERGVMDQVALEADELLGGREDSALLIDETAFTKKGEKSVGVARQWNGRLGKVDNCQVGVFGALCSGSASTLIDTRCVPSTEVGEGQSSMSGGEDSTGVATVSFKGRAGAGDGAGVAALGRAFSVG